MGSDRSRSEAGLIAPTSTTHAVGPRDLTDLEDLIEQIGPRLRALRQRRNLTLDALAAVTSISISTLSRLESGRRRPTLDLLLPIAAVYGIPLDEIVGEPQPFDPRITTSPIHKHDRTIIPLSRRADGLAVFKTILNGREPDLPVRTVSHPGHAWFYIVAGRMRLVLGDTEHFFDQGEAAEFDTAIPHGFVSATTEPAEAINVFDRYGERLQVQHL
jgi:transcriptional regulator with XRE-family HTH domain